MKISFIVPGNPQGKARPRVCRVNGKSITYTPKKTVEYEKLIRASYSAASGVKFEKNVPLEMNILALFSLPKTASKKISGKVTLPSREQSLPKQKETLCRAKGSVAGGLLENFKQSGCATCPTARWPAKKPDCDNIIKVICDALNGLAYHDDAQVCRVYFEKTYAPIPCVKVEIKAIKEV